MAIEWYVSKDGENRNGPYSEKELANFARDGQVLPTDLLWREGLPDWTPASKLKGLPFPAKAKAPPPLPGKKPKKPKEDKTLDFVEAVSAEKPKPVEEEEGSGLMIPAIIIGLLVVGATAGFFVLKKKPAETVAVAAAEEPKIQIAPAEKPAEKPVEPKAVEPERREPVERPAPRKAAEPAKRPAPREITKEEKEKVDRGFAQLKQRVVDNLRAEYEAARDNAKTKEAFLLKVAGVVEGKEFANSFIVSMIQEIEQGQSWKAADDWMIQNCTAETIAAYRQWREAKIIEQFKAEDLGLGKGKGQQAAGPDGRPAPAAGLNDKPAPEEPLKITVVHKIETPSPALAVAFTPDGSKLASGHEDKKLRLWDVESGKLIRELPADGSVEAIAFAEDGRLFYGGGKTIVICEPDFKRKGTATGHSSEVRSIVVSRDGKAFLSAGDNTIRVWDSRNGKQLTFIRVAGKGALSVDVSRDEKTFAVAHGNISIVDVSTVKVDEEIKAQDADRVLFASDGRAVISAHEGGAVTVWNANSGSEISRITGHEGKVADIAILSGGTMGITAGEDKTVRLWHLGTGKEIGKFTEHSAPVHGVAASSDKGIVATAGEDKFVYILNVSE